MHNQQKALDNMESNSIINSKMISSDYHVQIPRNASRKQIYNMNIIFKPGTYQSLMMDVRNYLRTYMHDDTSLRMLQLQDQQTQDMNYYFPHIQSWFKLTNAQFDGTYIPDIPQILTNIFFVDLKFLSLRNNQIQSVELLFKLQAPQLQFLQLSENNITSIKTIRKANWRMLQQFIVDDNDIIEFQNLFQGHFLSIKIINTQNHKNKTEQINILSTLPKLQTKSKSLQINFSKNDLLLSQTTIQQVLEKKFIQSKQFWSIFNTI